jgi:phosphohistidine phosphatase
MQRRLIIMRHAKSAWDTDAPDDHSRPLNERGRRDAPRMGRALEERGWVPDLVISSDSQRTRETWAGVQAELGAEPEVKFTRDLYHAGAMEIAEFCEEMGGASQTIMVLGHNPGWQQAVGYFSGERQRMTTANCALLEAEGEWADLMQASTWRLVDLLRPKDLPDEGDP